MCCRDIDGLFVLLAIPYLIACAAMGAVMAGLFLLGQMITGLAITNFGTLIAAGVVGGTIIFAGLGILFGIFASAKTDKPGWLIGGLFAGAVIGALTGVFQTLAPFVAQVVFEDLTLMSFVFDSPGYAELVLFNAVGALLGVFVLGISIYFLYGLVDDVGKGRYGDASGFEPTLDTDLDLSLSSKLAKRADLDFSARNEILAVTPKQSFINSSLDPVPVEGLISRSHGVSPSCAF